jgi:hypothetical protein
MEANREIYSLATLYDDSDTFVREAVLNRLIEGGESMLADIRFALIAENDPVQEERLKEMSEILRLALVKKDMDRISRSGDFTLEEGLRLLSVVNGEDLRGKYLEMIDNEVFEIISEISDQKTDVENIEIFNYLFFKRFGFTFSSPQIEDIRTINVADIIYSRKGNPIVVSILYFLYAGKSGLPVLPLSFPGGFVPVFLNPEREILFYLNVYRNGEIFMENNLKRFFSDSGLLFDEESLKVRDDKYLAAVYTELLKLFYNNIEGAVRQKSLLREISDMLGEEDIQ